MDKLTNILLAIRNVFYFTFGIKDKIVYPDKCKNISKDLFHDFGKTYGLGFKENYRNGQVWGDYAKDNPIQWYDPQAVTMTYLGLNLEVTNNRLIDKDVVIDTGVGLVVSKFTTSYGIYNWSVILPQGPLLWPAIWLQGKDKWPPEIDVMEAYSDSNGRYKHKLNTNAYFGITPLHSSVRAFSSGWFIDKSKPILLTLDWRKDYIKIYYNNVLVRVIKSKSVLNWFNEHPLMEVVMNNAVRTGHDNKKESSPFIVEWFSYAEG
jgi:beta-glucanase (GH16 family)